jgi:hypothetical protein
VGGHVFISYRHGGADAAYVDRLAAHLLAAGIPVWFDREIISGDRWHAVIQQHIDTCAAFIVVMTPDADSSQWVNREIHQAERTGKPILPLLLVGNGFFRLGDLQYDDVSDGRLPPPHFVDRVRRLTGLDDRIPAGSPVSIPAPLMMVDHEAERGAIASQGPRVQQATPPGRASTERRGRADMTHDLRFDLRRQAIASQTDLSKIDAFRRTFTARRFGAGYDAIQVNRLFDAIIASLSGRSNMPLKESELDPNQFSLVPGGYFEAEVNQALREVRDLVRRANGRG